MRPSGPLKWPVPSNIDIVKADKYDLINNEHPVEKTLFYRSV